MIGTSTPRPRTLRTISGTAAAASSVLTVTRTSCEPGVGEPRDLDRRRVGVRGVGVRHRLDDDRVGAAHEDAADVDADGRPARRPQHVGRVMGAERAPGQAADDVEAGDPDDEREQEHEADHVGQLLGAEADPPAEQPLERDHQHPAAVERRERQDVHERQVGRQDARDVQRQDRAERSRTRRRSASRCRPGRRPAAAPSDRPRPTRRACRARRGSARGPRPSARRRPRSRSGAAFVVVAPSK